MFKAGLNNSKGITLVELVVSLAILGIVLSVIFSLFIYGTKSFSIGTNQYDVQSEARLTTDALIEELRFATSLEILDVSLINTPILQEDGFNYIYISGGDLYKVTYDAVADTHTTMITQGNYDEALSAFTYVNDSTLSLAIFSESNNQSYNVQTEVSLLNLKSGVNAIIGSSDLGLKYKKNDNGSVGVAGPAAPTNHTLTVAVSSGGTATGSGSFHLNQSVNISATANSGYQFVNWTAPAGFAGYLVDANLPTTTVMMPNQALTVTANFTLAVVTLTDQEKVDEEIAKISTLLVGITLPASDTNPRIYAPSIVNGVAFKFTARTQSGGATISIDTPNRLYATVGRHSSQNRTGTITLEASLNGKVKTKIFTVSIPSGSGTVTAVQQ